MRIVLPIGLQGGNASAVAALRKALDRSLVLPFVGAGLSKQCGYPLWAEFLEDCAVRAHVDVSKYLRTGEYEDAAERLLKMKGRPWFDAHIRRVFGRARECPRSIAASFLPRLTPGPVVTTNFDRVLEDVFREAGDPFWYEVWGGQPRLSDRMLSEDAHVLVKVHGDANHHNGRVLTRSDYADQYGLGGRRPTPLTTALLRLLSDRPILFLGCRVEDDRYLRLVRRVRLPRGGSHFAVLPARPNSSWMRQRTKYLRSLRIRPLWYEDRQHEAVAEVLEWLTSKPRLRRRRRAGSVAAIRTMRDLDYNVAISLERSAPSSARRIHARLARSRRPDLAVASLRQLALLHKLDGRPVDALRLLRQAIRRSGGILDQRARAYTHVGMVLDDMSDLARAREAYSRALKDYRRLHDHSGMAGAFDNLGTIALQRQRWSEADRLFERAFHHAQIAGPDDDVIVIRRNQAHARYQRAKRLLNEGRPMHVVRRDLEEADEHLTEAMVRQPHGQDYAAALTERAY